MRPSIATFSPLTPGCAKLSVMSQVSPICRYGPIVCDDVVWRLIVVPPRLRLTPLRCPQRGSNSRLGTARRRSFSSRHLHVVFEWRLIAAPQDDVEFVAERLFGNRRFPIER